MAEMRMGPLGERAMQNVAAGLCPHGSTFVDECERCAREGEAADAVERTVEQAMIDEGVPPESREERADEIRAAIREAETPTIVDVEITRDVGGGISGFTVDPIWSGVDRPNTGGYLVRTRELAERLARAMRAGVVYYDVERRTDVTGATFAATRSRVLGRMVNADLRRLGY